MQFKPFLILAQVLGLFPASGLCRAKSEEDLKCCKCSFAMFYSWITWLIRIFLKAIFVLGTYFSTLSDSRTKNNATGIGLTLTFCTGPFYQMMSLYNCRGFIILLQKLEIYDTSYPKTSVKKRRIFFSVFFIFNIMFLLTTLVFPISYLIGILRLMERTRLSEGKYFFRDQLSESWLEIVSFTVISLIFIEAATLFPVIQITKLVQKLEERLEVIQESIKEYIGADEKIHNGEIFLLKVYKSSEKEAHQKLCSFLTSKNQNFWKKLTNQYLKYVELFSSFTDFAEIYFILSLPMQIISTVAMIYLMLISGGFKSENFVDIAFKMIMYMCLAKIWTWCNVYHKLEKIHGEIMRNALEVERSQIFSEEEKVEYDKFIKVVRYLPIQMSAGSYFTVNRRCIPSVISAIASYIIVLLQFKDSEGNTTDYDFWKNLVMAVLKNKTNSSGQKTI